MTIQNKAIYMLEGLKGAGISYKQFAEVTGINLDQIYARKTKNSKFTDQRAAYYLGAAQKHFPEQYAIIKQHIDEMEIQGAMCSGAGSF